MPSRIYRKGILENVRIPHHFRSTRPLQDIGDAPPSLAAPAINIERKLGDPSARVATIDDAATSTADTVMSYRETTGSRLAIIDVTIPDAVSLPLADPFCHRHPPVTDALLLPPPPSVTDALVQIWSHLIPCPILPNLPANNLFRQRPVISEFPVYLVGRVECVSNSLESKTSLHHASSRGSWPSCASRWGGSSQKILL
jgi:hypothetical protein